MGETLRSTTLQSGDVSVPPQNMLAALYASGIDNAVLELDGPEVPILDGSALPFMSQIEKAGTTEQKPTTFLKSEEHRLPGEDGVEMLVVPRGERFKVTVMVDYNSLSSAPNARMENLGAFKADIAGCRTFVFLKEVASLAEQGLIQGGDIGNAVVLAERAYSETEMKEIAQALGRDTLSGAAKSQAWSTPPIFGFPTNLHVTSCWTSWETWR